MHCLRCLTLALTGGSHQHRRSQVEADEEEVAAMEEERTHAQTSSSTQPPDAAAASGDAPLAMASRHSRTALATPRGRVKRRVVFAQPLYKEMWVPALCDISRHERDDMYWNSEDYAAIRDNQRRLIELVMRQVRQYPEGTVPPPIPGESRRGLGIICEPGTNSGRATRVRSARRAVVEAYRDGYSPEMIGKLAAELSLWATKNAYDVGVKDEQAAKTADFDLDSFATLERCRISLRSESSDSITASLSQPVGPGISRVARATRRLSNNGDTEGSTHTIAANDSIADNNALPPMPKQEFEEHDGLGLASMIRKDSLNNLATLQHQALPDAPTLNKSSVEHVDQQQPDGMGLASMIRTDSLGNLNQLDTQHSTSSDASQTDVPVVAY